MNSGSACFISDSSDSLDEVFQRQWRQQLAGWRQLLARCGKKPGRRRVHELRVATLRLEALLELWLHGHERDPAARAVRRWSKQAARLRRALQPARSAAVYLGKLAWLRRQVVAGDARRAACLRQIAALERRFVKRREAAEKELMEAIRNRRARLVRWSEEIEGAIPVLVAQGGALGMDVMRERAGDLTAEFPVLSADCLHGYRKRVKKLHYLADFFAAVDSRAARQAEIFGKMQAVIGEWRDWQSLARKACRVFVDRESGLPKLLAGLEAKSLRRALRDCRRLRERLLENDVAENALGKKPVQVARLDRGQGEKPRRSWG